MITITKSQMKATVEQVANGLDKSLGRITTLELKNELIKQYPAIMWYQYTTNGVAGVSDLFHELVGEGRFISVADNGTYQTYRSNITLNNQVQSLGKALNKSSKATPKAKVATTVASSKKTITRLKALDLMKNNKGRFFTVTFKKQDGTQRTLNGQFVKDQTQSPLGYVLVKEASKLKTSPKDCIRNVNLQTLKSVKVGGVLYNVK